MKKIGYLIFALFFHIFRLCPVKKYKVFLLATHDDSKEGNVGIMADCLAKEDKPWKFVWLTRKDGIRHPFSYFIGKSYHLATAGTIFMDNAFLPMAYLHFSQKTRVVQLWHGTGTIKKLCQDVNTGSVKEYEYKANQRITDLIVNSDYMKKIYGRAFAVADDKIRVLGMPRTDLLLDEEFGKKKRHDFYEEYEELKDKRLILYAPTFRDDEVDKVDIHLDLEDVNARFPKDCVLLLRLHPHVAARFPQDILKTYEGRILNMSDYDGVTTLLLVSDCLITDYSSIIFEYCLQEKKMLFYAYDLDKFEKQGRSFYENYEEYVPGTVVQTQDELLEQLETREEDILRAHKFKMESFPYLDGMAATRLKEMLF